jgi:hypothetical protein
MRHFFLPCAIASGALGMSAAAAQAQLITPCSGALRVAPGQRGTILCAIDVAAIAARTDEHLDAAARAKEEARGCICLLSCVTQTWTRRTTGGILPRHACTRTMWGAAPIRTARLGSAPCLSSRRTGIYRTFFGFRCSCIPACWRDQRQQRSLTARQTALACSPVKRRLLATAAHRCRSDRLHVAAVPLSSCFALLTGCARYGVL